MATLAYRDDKILARNLLSRPFFCLTPAEPFFRPDRSSTAPSCRVAVKDGRAFRGHPKGLSLTAASTMARWRYRSGRRPCVAAEPVSSPRRSSRFRLPFPQCLQKFGNSNGEVHRLSRFSDHQSACSCSVVLQQTEAALACLAQAEQSNGTPQLGEVHQTRRSLLSANQDTPPFALSPLRRQNPREEILCRRDGVPFRW